MGVSNLNPQFLVDESGNKSLVVLTVKEYEELLEDLHDLAVMAERRDEPRLSLEGFEKGLKADGII